MNIAITRPNTIIPYFPAYLIYHFYDSKTRCNCQKTDYIFEISVQKKCDDSKNIKNI